MSYFKQISPEVEDLLGEIIELKANKADTEEYWNKRFEEVEDEWEFRGLFKELSEKQLVNVQWADDIPYILFLTSKGKKYFEHKNNNKTDFKRSIVQMHFEYLDIESENMLSDLLSRDWSRTYEMKGTVIKNLSELGYVKSEKHEYISDSESTYEVEYITQKGKTYFEMKDRYEKQLELNRPITNNMNITTSGNNSPVNAVQGPGSATQTGCYVNNEKLKALSQLSDMINSAKEFSEEERAELLELIEGAKNSAKENKTTMLKTILIGKGSGLVKAPSFILDKWEEIKTMFGG